MNNEQIPTNTNINWASHVYAKQPLNSYEIRKLEKWVFTHFHKNEESFNNFIIGKN